MSVWMVVAIFLGGLLLTAAALIVATWAGDLLAGSEQIADGGSTRDGERD